MAVRDLSLRSELGNFFLCVFIAVCFSTGLSEEDLGSPLRTAQCRAGCVNKFAVVPLRLSSCLRDAECNMCWENCQLLQSFPAFEAICSKSSVCFAGCREACRFHAESLRNPANSQRQRAPVMITTGEKVLTSDATSLRWPRPRAAPPHDPLVYVVLRRAPGHAWRQLEQTLDQTTRVAPDAGALRVLAVNSTGLVAIYSPASRPALKGADIIMRSLGRAGLFPSDNLELKGGRRINTPVSHLSTTNPLKLLAGSEETQSSPSLWNLREISLIHQKVLVIAEIAWDARKSSPRSLPSLAPSPAQAVVYLVTWEIDGGGLKGNLFTNSTCVTLSLWPDTVCHIKVEVYQSNPRGKPDQSEELVLDTHRITPVEVDDAPQLDTQAPSSSPLSQPEPSTPSPLLANHHHNHSIQIWAVESDLADRRVEKVVGPTDSYHELVLGVLAAVVLFLVVVASLAVKNRRMDSVLLMYGSPKDVESKSKLVHEVREVPQIQEVYKGPARTRSCPQGSASGVKFFNEYPSWMSTSSPDYQSKPPSSSPSRESSPVATHLVSVQQIKPTPTISSVNFSHPNQTSSAS